MLASVLLLASSGTWQGTGFLLRALESDSRLEVLSRPTLLVENNEEANITIGDRVYTWAQWERTKEAEGEAAADGEEMSDGVIYSRDETERGVKEPIDWYEYKCELMQFLGIDTFCTDRL